MIRPQPPRHLGGHGKLAIPTAWIRLRSFAPGIAAGTLLVASPGHSAGPAASARRFEAQVRAYEAADRATPPPAGAILLAGDSQFYRWKTVHEDLPGYTIIDRGIDGFETSDLVAYADRLVLRYRPRLMLPLLGPPDHPAP